MFDSFDFFQKKTISNKLYNNGCNTRARHGCVFDPTFLYPPRPLHTHRMVTRFKQTEVNARVNA